MQKHPDADIASRTGDYMGRKPNRHCGIDAHESNLVAAIVDKDNNYIAETTFENDVEGHLDSMKWLRKNKTRHVGMESTGVYWKAFAQTLISNGFIVKVGNAEQMKRVPGRKTDKLDARWIARLLRDGYILESNILSKESDDFRSFVRLRLRLVRDRTAVKNRISALIAKSGLRMKCSDKFGRFGRKVIKSIAEGKPLDEIFKSPQGVRLGYSEDEFISLLETHITLPTRKQLQVWLERLEQLDQQIKEIEDVISVMIHQDEAKLEQLKILRSVPGFKDIASPVVMAEIGDISCFPTAAKFSAYCGLVSSIYQSGEREVDGEIVKKIFMGRPRRRCNKRLKWIFVFAANIIVGLPDTPLVKPLKTFYYRILRRSRGRYAKQRALVALAHKLAKIVWTVLTKGEKYHGDGGCTKNVSPLRKPELKGELDSCSVLDKAFSVLCDKNERSCEFGL